MIVIAKVAADEMNPVTITDTTAGWEQKYTVKETKLFNTNDVCNNSYLVAMYFTLGVYVV